MIALSLYRVSHPKIAKKPATILTTEPQEQDGETKTVDWSMMKANYFSGTTLEQGDLNKDGTVNSLDWSIIRAASK